MSRRSPAARTLRGRRRYREVMVSEAPPPMTPYLDKGDPSTRSRWAVGLSLLSQTQSYTSAG